MLLVGETDQSEAADRAIAGRGADVGEFPSAAGGAAGGRNADVGESPALVSGATVWLDADVGELASEAAPPGGVTVGRKATEGGA